MPSLHERFSRVLEELDAHPDVTVSERTIEPPLPDPIPEDIDAELRATWAAIGRVDIQWSKGEKHFGSLVVLDAIDYEDAFVMPDAGGDPALLANLRLIECLEALHWTAHRTDTGKVWTRIPGELGRIPLDLPLDGGWSAYVERMLLARGAEKFALTLVPDAAVPRAVRSQFAQYLQRFCDAASIFDDPELARVVDASRRRV